MTTPSTAGEQDLLVIREIRNGNAAAYEKIMRRYNQQLYRIGIAFLGSPEEVEDVMQNTFLKAWYNLWQYKAEAAFGSWLIRIMINECKQAIRKQARKRLAYREWTQGKEEAYDQGTEKKLIQKEMKHLIEEAILQLPEKYRTVFVLRELEHFSTEDTALYLQISAENVKVRLLRAKAMLRKLLMQTVAGQEMFTFRGYRCDAMVQRVMKIIEGEKRNKEWE